MRTPADIEEIFGAAYRRMLELDPDVEPGKILHSTGLKTHGKFFAFVTRGELVVKLPQERVDELVAAGIGLRMDMGGRRPMREWVRLQPFDEDECLEPMREACGFVAALAARSAAKQSSDRA